MSNYTGVGTDDAIVGSQAPAQSVTVGASPFTFKATAKGSLNISGGTVSAVSHGRQAVSHSLGGVSGSFYLSAGDSLTITYSAAPTLLFIPH